MNNLTNYFADTWHFFKMQLLGIATVLFPLLIPIQLALALTTSGGANAEVLTQSASLVLVSSLFLYPVHHGALVSFIRSRVESKDIAVADHYRLALQLWMPMLVMYVMVLVSVIAGLTMFLLPGLYIYVRLSYAEFYCLLERQPPFEAIVSSWRATEAQQWQLLPGVILLWCLTTLPILWVQNIMPEVFSANTIPGFLFALVAGVFSSLLTIFRYRLYTESQRIER